MESPPPGTFNYRDARRYTPAEALDVLNSVLLTKGYTLVRHDKMLVVVNLEDGIPPNLVSDVPLAELDQRGQYELIRVLFPVYNMTPEAAAKEVEPMLGPQGAVVVLPQAHQIAVTETGGRLRAIRSVINAVERPADDARSIREFPLKYFSVDDAMPYLRQMLNIPTDAFSTPDGLLHLGKDVSGWRLLVQGTPDRVARVDEVLKLIDVPDASNGITGAPQLEVYPITTADPQAVLQVLQTLLAGDTSVKLAVDPISGHLVAVARPGQQATIRATIDQMQRDARQVAVIPLSSVDPQVAVLSINKLFGGLDKDKPDPSAPRVDSDPTTRSLLVRGTGGQVQQIRELLQSTWRIGRRHRLRQVEGARAAFAAHRRHGSLRIQPNPASLANAAAQQHPHRHPFPIDSNLSPERFERRIAGRRAGRLSSRRRQSAPAIAGDAQSRSAADSAAKQPQGRREHLRQNLARCRQERNRFFGIDDPIARQSNRQPDALRRTVPLRRQLRSAPQPPAGMARRSSSPPVRRRARSPPTTSKPSTNSKSCSPRCPAAAAPPAASTPCFISSTPRPAALPTSSRRSSAAAPPEAAAEAS